MHADPLTPMLSDTPLHAPPPVGKGVYWAVRQDWRPPVFLGAGFCVVVVLALLPHFLRLDRLQKETFAEVGAYLKSHDIHDSPAQRACVLTRTDDVFYWRGIAWKNNPSGGGGQRFLFAVKVDTESGRKIVEAALIPYEKRRAEALGVYIDELP